MMNLKTREFTSLLYFDTKKLIKKAQSKYSVPFYYFLFLVLLSVPLQREEGYLLNSRCYLISNILFVSEKTPEESL